MGYITAPPFVSIVVILVLCLHFMRVESLPLMEIEDAKIGTNTTKPPKGNLVKRSISGGDSEARNAEDSHEYSEEIPAKARDHEHKEVFLQTIGKEGGKTFVDQHRETNERENGELLSDVNHHLMGSSMSHNDDLHAKIFNNFNIPTRNIQDDFENDREIPLRDIGIGSPLEDSVLTGKESGELGLVERLAAYVIDTGDFEGVVKFLNGLLSDLKIGRNDLKKLLDDVASAVKYARDESLTEETEISPALEDFAPFEDDADSQYDLRESSEPHLEDKSVLSNEKADELAIELEQLRKLKEFRSLLEYAREEQNGDSFN